MSVFFEELVKHRIEGYDFSVLATNQINKEKFTGWKRRCINLINAVLLTGRFLIKLIALRPRIVHVQTNSGSGLFEKTSLLLLARIIRSRTVLHIHGGGFRDYYHRSPNPIKKLIRSSLNRADRIIVLSEQMKSLFHSIGIPEEKLAIVPNGVNLPDQTSSRNTDEPLTVLFLNRIDIAKGIHELIEAAELVCKKADNICFKIVGPPSNSSQWAQQVVREKNLTDQIKIQGPVSGPQKDRQFINSDIYVLPSHLEALPIGLLEAMSYGLPCIATTVGAVPEIIEDGNNGLLVPPKDSNRLAEAIMQLIQNSKMRNTMGENARNTILQKYTWQHTIQALKTVFDSINPRNTTK